ncbi:hypothetical protein GCM10020001_061210 [Nonomuraea salmonea]
MTIIGTGEKPDVAYTAGTPSLALGSAVARNTTGARLLPDRRGRRRKGAGAGGGGAKGKAESPYELEIPADRTRDVRVKAKGDFAVVLTPHRRRGLRHPPPGGTPQIRHPPHRPAPRPSSHLDHAPRPHGHPSRGPAVTAARVSHKCADAQHELSPGSKSSPGGKPSGGGLRHRRRGLGWKCNRWSPRLARLRK